MAATGCALSLHCNEDDYNAIKILELGRGTISRLTINSKSDLSALAQHHPNLAKRFEDLRFIINNPFHSTDAGQKTAPNSSSLSADLEDLLSEIRREEGFENFQDLPSKDKLLETGKGETIVFFNTTQFRTDAILINGNGFIRALPLDPSISNAAWNYYAKLRSRFGYDGTPETWKPANEDMSSFLRWLWDFMVKPVFDTLNLEPLTGIYEQEKSSHEDEIARSIRSSATRNSGTLHADRLAILRKLMTRHPSPTSSVDIQPPSQNNSQGSADVSKLPRVHWIGVGFLGVFPFHAAGYGSQDPTSNTMSHAISSYAASLTTLSFAKYKPMTLAASHSKLLLVTMPYTPGQAPLSGVDEEGDIIQKKWDSKRVKLLRMPIVQSVLDGLPYYDIVHFACHGFADPKSPFQSGLFLRGDEPGTPFYKNIRNSTLTVERISSMNLKDSQLAYLSACCTAQNSASALVDEGIHLARGFQLSGFPHVVAHLWEADDELSVAMTERFYQTVIGWSDVNGHRKIACALHEAVLSARQVCPEPLRWATIIHFGP